MTDIKAEYMTVMLRREHGYSDVRPVSAGSINLGGTWVVDESVPGKIAVKNGPTVSGSSDTLKLKSDPEDARTITLYQYNNGLSL